MSVVVPSNLVKRDVYLGQTSHILSNAELYSLISEVKSNNHFARIVPGYSNRDVINANIINKIGVYVISGRILFSVSYTMKYVLEGSIHEESFIEEYAFDGGYTEYVVCREHFGDVSALEYEGRKYNRDSFRLSNIVVRGLKDGSSVSLRYWAEKEKYSF